MIADRCIYCQSVVEYPPEASYVNCPRCGGEILKTEFKSERDKLIRIEDNLRQAKEALAVAETEKAQADQRLFHALEDLDCLKEGQQDTLSQLLRAMTQGQENAGGKLRALQSISEKILQGQSSIFEIIGSIKDLQMSMEEKARLAQDFLQWSQTAHEEDTARLEVLKSSTGAILEGQEKAKKNLEELQSKADEALKTLNAFQAEYHEDKITFRENLFKQAEDYQFDRKYEQAEEAYRRLIVAGEQSAEIYWRVLLCHYGVKYRKSDEKNQYIPTILQPDLTDPAEMSDRKNLFAQCKTEEEKQHYARELARIDNILEAYRLHRNDAKFDVFISVKQKDGANYTVDSKKATDLFYKLKEWGFKVFNSDSALTPSPAGELFEPYIISAILSSRVMIVVGTKKEYMNADWVRDEWTRFSWLKKREEKASGHSKRLLFCYLANGMQPEDIPEGLDFDIQHMIEDLGAESVLRESLKSVFPEKFTVQPPPPLQPPIDPALWEKEKEELLKKRLDLAMTFIRQGRFQKAEAELDDPDLLRVSPNNPDIWLCKALIRANARTVDDLYYAGPELKQNEEFKTAIEKATGALKKQLQECLMWSDYTPVQLSDGTIGITKYLGDKEDTAQIPTGIKNKVVTRIMDSCFENCQALLHVVIPESVISIGSRAFAGCTSLTEIAIPNNVNLIEDEAFVGCASLQAINVESNNNTYFSFDGVLFTKEQNESTLICYPQGRSEGEYILPSSVSSIAHCAFYNCTSLRQITFHNKMISIADSAFVDCYNLEMYGQSGSEIEKYTEKNNIPFHDRALEEEEYTHFLRAQHFLNEAEKSGGYFWSNEKFEKNKVAVKELAQIHSTLKNEVNRDKYIQLVIKWKKLALGSSNKRIDRILSLFTVILVALFLGVLLYFGHKKILFYHIECPVSDAGYAEIFPNNFLIPIGKWFCTLLKPFGIDNFISLHSESCSLILGLFSAVGFFIAFFVPMLLPINVTKLYFMKKALEYRREKREIIEEFNSLLHNENIYNKAKEILRVDELNHLWHGIGSRLGVALGIATGFLCFILQHDYFSGFSFLRFTAFVNQPPLLRLAFLVVLPGLIVTVGTQLFFDHFLDTKAIIGKRIMASYNDNIKKWDERNNNVNCQ